MRVATTSASCSRRCSGARSTTPSDLADLQAARPALQGDLREPRGDRVPGRRARARSYVARLEALLDAGCYVGVATHDEQLCDRRPIDRRGIGRDDYEFQMLLGVAEELRAAGRGDGRPLRIYVPYGERWYEYCCAGCRRTRASPASREGHRRRMRGAATAAPVDSSGGQREAAVDDQRLAADHLGVGRAEE